MGLWDNVHTRIHSRRPLSEQRFKYICQRFARLRNISSLVASCGVLAEAQAKHHAHGDPFAVKLDITVPGDGIIVSRRDNENVYEALGAAFDAAELQLESYAQLRRGDRRDNLRADERDTSSVGSGHE